jgi:hypothetical protein
VRDEWKLARYVINRGVGFARVCAYVFHFLDADRSGTIEAHKLRLRLHAYAIRLPPNELARRWAAAVGADEPSTELVESGSLTLE